MKKQDILGIIVYLLILALAAVFGLVVIREYSPKSGMDTGVFVLFVMGAIVAGLLFNAILYELAHVLGAKIGGYKVTSVAILGFTWVKEYDKVRFHFGSFDGLTGETKILPITGRSKKSNPLPYLVLGTVFYAIEVVAVVLLFSVLTREGASVSNSNLGYFLLIMMAVGGMILLYNIIPFQLDSMTDGYRLRLVSGKKNKDAFNAMLLGETGNNNQENEENHIQEGSSFSSNLKLNQIYVLLQEDKYQEAESLVDDIIASAATDKKITARVLEEARVHKIYLIFVNEGEEAAREYCEKNLTLRDKKDLSDETNLTYLRTYVLISGILDRSHSECLRTLSKAFKAYKRTPEGRRELESQLFNKAVDMVLEKHPDWEDIKEYHINLE